VKVFQIVFIFLLSNPCFSQSDKWISQSQHDLDILKSMKIVYNKPDGFKEVNRWECFKCKPKLEYILTCANNQLHSDDEQFIAFIPVYKFFTRKDSVDMKKRFPGMPFNVIDKIHSNTIKNNIKMSLGEDAARDYKKYIIYYSPEEAKRKFNADTAISFRIKLDSNDYYEEKYNHLDALFLQKKGRGYINFYCFYTDSDIKRLPEYWKAIEEVFKYED
jgi:hypothetical protein